MGKELWLSGYSTDSLVGAANMSYHFMQNSAFLAPSPVAVILAPGTLAFQWHRGEGMTFLLLYFR